ncbi:alpha/beta fold hydrolase [Pseudodesulfovibrio portus]|uniref:Alpha/beta hydrolase n=1 Tax=Pseudodesulfovibrio portus TaxID=231439 RepID=A0ABM8ASE2_9BACT|nr:hypothetical protein [Pseudodesulfovibrio portus]BDQ34354.1 hypothetical protein JCM14722_18960 [Pseudodesulfovibrio portus]
MTALARAARRGLGVALLLAAGLFLSGCRGTFPADGFAGRQGFVPRVSHGATFDLKWYLRGTGPVLRAYIEGDGKAWLNRRRPSTDPTPAEATAFALAARDTGPAVAYLARPCQFTNSDERRNCSPVFWTSARFSEPVVSDLSLVLDQAMHAAGARRLQLVGFSGGGAIALLEAARRDDVELVVTVAGNLDHAFWTGLHRVSPLRDSLNPADFARRLQSVDQIHIVGADDAVMPPAVVESYIGRMDDPSRVRVVTVRGVAHTDDWGPALSAVLEGLE